MSPDLCGEALFVSPLQPSWEPSAEQVGAAVEAMVLLHGSEGCAELVAQEFGDHPLESAERMRWCCRAVRDAFSLAGSR